MRNHKTSGIYHCRRLAGDGSLLLLVMDALVGTSMAHSDHWYLGNGRNVLPPSIPSTGSRRASTICSWAQVFFSHQRRLRHLSAVEDTVHTVLLQRHRRQRLHG